MGGTVGTTGRARGVWWVAALTVVATVAGWAPSAAPVGAAPPTCSPTSAPVVVGSARDRLVVSVPQCASSTGLLGYRVLASVGSGSTPVAQADVGVGVPRAELTGLTAGSVVRVRVASRNADGVGPTTAPSAPAFPPFTGAALFTDRQYRDFAGRAPTAGEASQWASSLGAGSLTPVAAIDGLQAGAYWQVQSPVIRLYQAYFLRLPDLGGIDYWTARMRTGTTLTTVSSAFAGSAEFRNRYGTLTNRAFVEQVYANVLGRPGEAAGVDYWTTQLDQRRINRGQMMIGFSESAEYKNATVGVVAAVNLFTGMLRRVPTASEATTWGTQPRSATITHLLGSAAYEARVRVDAPPAITTTELPAARVGVAFDTTLAAIAGQGARTFSVTAGSLPSGLSLAPTTGRISGVPSALGTVTFTVTVRDAAGRTDARPLTIVVTADPPPVITTTSLPAGKVGVAYDATLGATGGQGARTFSVTTGALPPGLTLASGTGRITGSPTSVGTIAFTVTVRDTLNRTDDQALSIAVTSDPVVTTAGPLSPQVGVSFSATLAVTGGTAPYTWAVASGSLPAGLNLSATGALSGTPTGVGRVTVTVRVTDAASRTATRAIVVDVVASQDWAQQGRDGTQRAWSPNEAVITPANVAGLTQEWATARPSYAAVAVAGGTAYSVGLPPKGLTGAYELFAVGLADGVTAWSVPLPLGVSPTEVVVTATAVLVNGDGVNAYRRAAPHDLLWSTQVTDPNRGADLLAVSGSTLVVRGANSEVLAYDLADGQRIWRQTVTPSQPVADVAVSGSTVVVAFGDRLKAFDRATGATLWTRTGLELRDAAFAIGDGWVYATWVSPQGSRVGRFALADGAPGWSTTPLFGGVRVLAVDDGTVYVERSEFGDDGYPRANYVEARRIADGTLRWERLIDAEGRAGFVSSAAVTGDLAWFVLSVVDGNGPGDSALVALHRTDGALLTSVAAGAGQGPAAWGNGRVVVPTVTGLEAYGLGAPRPVITTRVLSARRVGTAASETLVATNGTAPYTWAVTSGTLPAGLGLSSAGVLSGTPTAAGAPRFTVRATDARGAATSVALVAQVDGPATGRWSTTGADAGRTGRAEGETAVGVATVGDVQQSWQTVSIATDPTFVSDPTREPVVVGGRLYDVAADHTLRAWSTAGITTNRASLWTAAAQPGHGFISGVTEAAGTLYVLDDENALYAFRASDGVRLWRNASFGETGAPFLLAPLVVGDAVVFQSASGRVRSVSAATGAARWSGTGPNLDRPNQALALASDGTRAFVSDGCVLSAVSLATGAVVWDEDISRPGTVCEYYLEDPTNITVSSGIVVMGGPDDTVAFAATDGALRWRSTIELQAFDSGGGISASHGLVIGTAVRSYAGGGGFTATTALDLATGELVWTADYGSYGTPTIAGDLVLAWAPGSLVAYDVRSGEQLWDSGEIQGAFYPKSRPVVAGGRIYLGLDDGLSSRIVTFAPL